MKRSPCKVTWCSTAAITCLEKSIDQNVHADLVSITCKSQDLGGCVEWRWNLQAGLYVDIIAIFSLTFSLIYSPTSSHFFSFSLYFLYHFVSLTFSIAFFLAFTLISSMSLILSLCLSHSLTLSLSVSRSLPVEFPHILYVFVILFLTHKFLPKL